MSIEIWRKAAEQMFFSLSVSWGGLIMFGSYNKFRHKVHYPAFIISSLDFVTSIIAGVVVFSILGELKMKGGYDSIEDVVKQKQGLAFVAYPEAISHLAVPQVCRLFTFLKILHQLIVYIYSYGLSCFFLCCSHWDWIQNLLSWKLF